MHSVDRGEHQYLCRVNGRCNRAALCDGVPVDQHHVDYVTEEAVRTQGITAKTRKWLRLADLSV